MKNLKLLLAVLVFGALPLSLQVAMILGVGIITTIMETGMMIMTGMTTRSIMAPIVCSSWQTLCAVTGREQ